MISLICWPQSIVAAHCFSSNGVCHPYFCQTTVILGRKENSFFFFKKQNFSKKKYFAIADWLTSNCCERHSFDVRGMEIAHNVVKIKIDNQLFGYKVR